MKSILLIISILCFIAYGDVFPCHTETCEAECNDRPLCTYCMSNKYIGVIPSSEGCFYNHEAWYMSHDKTDGFHCAIWKLGKEPHMIAGDVDPPNHFELIFQYGLDCNGYDDDADQCNSSPHCTYCKSLSGGKDKCKFLEESDFSKHSEFDCKIWYEAKPAPE